LPSCIGSSLISVMSYFGLTGGVATGKSTAARMFHALGAQIVDADRVGHELLGKSSPAFPEIVERFGAAILDASGEISRRQLGAVVFADPEKLQQLNAIVHPRIIAQVEERAAEFAAQNSRAVILVDAALIFEAGIGGRFEKVIVTCCRPEQQLQRLMDKGLTKEEAERRIAAQIPVEEKERRADFVIDSSGPLENTRAQVERIYSSLEGMTRGEN
jgi:dephospho-CoA kinase